MASDWRDSSRRPTPSRSHWIAEPAEKIEPSSA